MEQQEEVVVVEWLRGAATLGFDAIAKFDYVELATERDVDAFFEGIHAELFR